MLLFVFNIILSYRALQRVVILLTLPLFTRFAPMMMDHNLDRHSVTRFWHWFSLARPVHGIQSSPHQEAVDLAEKSI